MLPDGVSITLDVDDTHEPLTAVSLPGSFVPETGALQLALPIMQGLLYSGYGIPFERTLPYGGHEAFSMAMLGYLTERAGLLLSIKDYAGWRGVISKRSGDRSVAGQHYAFAEQVASLGTLRYPRRVRLYPTDAGLTALCKRYRTRVQERGDWKGWDEKIAECPSLERLAAFWTVPMTMLVYHDSAVHDWWELHNYNNTLYGQFQHASNLGNKEEGHPREKAAMDALYGCPPNVFAFGRQYYWVGFPERKTDSFTVSLDDTRVKEALAIALPVAQLHRRIGRLEMIAHEFLSADGAVQATTFADGTRVIANFAPEPREVPGHPTMAATSWRTSER